MRTALALILCTTTLASASIVAERLPPEAYGAVWVADMKAAREAFGAQPYMQLLLDDQVGIRSPSNLSRRIVNRLPTSPADPLSALVDAIVPQAIDGIVNGWISMGSVIRLNPTEITQSFDGGVAMYSTLLGSQPADSGPESTEWDAVFAAEVLPGRRDAAEAFLKSALPALPPRATRRRVTYQGVTVEEASYAEEEGVTSDGFSMSQSIPIVVQWGWCDDVLLISEGRGEPLRKAIAALKSDSPGSWLSRTRGYAQTAALTESTPASVHLFFDIGRKLTVKANTGSGRENVRRAEAFGVRNAHPIQAVLQVRDRAMELHVAVTTPPDAPARGVLRVLTSGQNVAPIRPAFVPEQAHAWGLLNVDLGTAYLEFQSIISILEPNSSSVIPTMLSLVQQKAEVEMTTDLIGPIEGDLVCYVQPRSNTPGDLATTIVLPLAEGTAAPAALDRVMQSMAAGDLRLIDMTRTDLGEGRVLWEPTPLDPATPQATGLFLGSMPRAFLFTGNRAEAVEQLARLASNPPAPSGSGTADALPLRAVSRTTQAALLYDFQLRRTNAERATGLSTSFPGSEHIQRAMGGLEFDLRANPHAVLASWTILPP